MGITLHTAPEKKIKPLKVDDSLYHIPVHFDIVERVVPIQQEDFVIYQEKKTTAPKVTAPAPQRPQVAERKVVYFEQEKPQVAPMIQAAATAPAQENGKIVHTLENYLEVEEMLTQARSPQRDTEEEEFKAELRIKEPAKTTQPKETNQNAYLSALKENAANRKTTFKNMSYQFSSQTNYKIEDLENTPAYMRKNVDISSTTMTPSVSRSSISLDSNNIAQIRENNSYLHDNVD